MGTPDREKADILNLLWKREERRKRRGLILRWTMALLLIVLSYQMMNWFTPFLLLLACILVAMDIAGYLSTVFVDVLWNRRPAEPRPMYGIPEALAAKGQYAEAEAEYEKIIQEFPDEVKPHIDLITIAVRRLNDGELAERIFQRGMGLLRNKKDREVLQAAYESIRTLLKTPENTTREPLRSRRLVP